VNRNKNKILYSVVPKEGGSILNVSVDSTNSKLLKNFYETLEEKSPKDIEGEIIYGSSYSSLKVFLEGEMEKYEGSLYDLIYSIKNSRYGNGKNFI
jgi:hypothetical protein